MSQKRPKKPTDLPNRIIPTLEKRGLAPEKKQFNISKKKKAKSKLTILTGLKASEVTRKLRPYCIKEVYYDKGKRRNFKDFLQPVGPYNPTIIRGVEPEDMKKISGGISHEGIAMKIDPPPFIPIERFPFDKPPPVVLALDHISNPHNYGALFRVAAFLGVTHVIQEKTLSQAKPSGSAMRVSQGGIEHCKIYEVENLAETLSTFQKKGFHVIGTDVSERSEPPAKATRPLVLVLGNEENGLRNEVQEACTELVKIPGAKIESLNVVVAGGILLHHYLNT